MEQRGATRRSWIKLYVTGWLHGSVRWQLTAEERGTFADLLVKAGECNRDGEISDNDGQPFPLDFIANQLNISLDLLDSTLEKCEANNRLLLREGIIYITNWKAYQSEYGRQKPYRGKERVTDDATKFKGQKHDGRVKR